MEYISKGILVFIRVTEAFNNLAYLLTYFWKVILILQEVKKHF